MLKHLGFLLILLAAVCLNGCNTCCGTAAPVTTYCNTCPGSSCGCCPNPYRSPVPFSGCSPCCIKTPYPRTPCPRCCGGTRASLIQQLACQNVQVIELGNTVNIIIFVDNCFKKESPTIDEGCYNTMDNVVELIKTYGPICGPFQITGYTDKVGDICGKPGLAQHLADSVAAYFWTHGMPLWSFSAKGGIYCEPIASPHTTRGNAYNRRVEIHFWRQHLNLHDPYYG